MNERRSGCRPMLEAIGIARNRKTGSRNRSATTTLGTTWHRTPVLTIGRYSHTRLHDLTGALDALPDLQPLEPTLQALQATGTDGNCRSAGREAQRVAQQTARDAVRIHATPCDEATDSQETQTSPKSSSFADLGDDVRRCAEGCEQRRRWELNPRWRICNPLP